MCVAFALTQLCKYKLYYCTYSTEGAFRDLHDGAYNRALVLRYTLDSDGYRLARTLYGSFLRNATIYPSSREDNPRTRFTSKVKRE